jgi:cytochrome c-type biogenesis protein CcmE
MTARQRRFLLLALVLAVLGLGGALLLRAFQSNLVFFVTPSQVVQGEVNRADTLRLGGLVQPGSIHREAQSLRVRFVLSDGGHQIPVMYEGVLPDLFVAGKGAIAQGQLDATGTLQATDVLAKHDENYMPAAVHDALKRHGASAPGSQP